MIDRILSIVRRWVASAERDRIDQKFDLMDQRLDEMALSISEVNSTLKNLQITSFTNAELWEQRINSARTNSESLSDKFDIRFGYMEKSFEKLEGLVMDVLRKQ